MHMYSGPQDVLVREIMSEARKLRLKVQCVSLDKKIDPEVDISSLEAHTELRDLQKDATVAEADTREI